MGMKRRGINELLHDFNTWWDEFVLEVAKPLAIFGFVLGTVDVYTRGGIATNPYFSVGWSAIQAFIIDGLFFAVWWRFRGGFRQWERGNVSRYVSQGILLLIGLLLSVVAAMTNMIIGFQQLWGVSDSQAAMVQLGINPVQFTIARAILVVVVTIMVAFTYYTSGDIQYERLGHKKEAEPEQVSGVHTPTSTPPQPPTGMVRVSPVVPLLEQSRASKQEAVRQAIERRAALGLPVNLREIAHETGIRYDTVRHIAPKVRCVQKEDKDDDGVVCDGGIV
jgi:hypothetical protein